MAVGYWVIPQRFCSNPPPPPLPLHALGISLLLTTPPPPPHTHTHTPLLLQNFHFPSNPFGIPCLFADSLGQILPFCMIIIQNYFYSFQICYKQYFECCFFETKRNAINHFSLIYNQAGKYVLIVTNGNNSTCGILKHVIITLQKTRSNQEQRKEVCIT